MTWMAALPRLASFGTRAPTLNLPLTSVAALPSAHVLPNCRNCSPTVEFGAQFVPLTTRSIPGEPAEGADAHVAAFGGYCAANAIPPAYNVTPVMTARVAMGKRARLTGNPPARVVPLYHDE